MEQWSVTLTGDVQPGVAAEATWARVAARMGQDEASFAEKVRGRLPVTLQAADEARARRQLQMLEGCGAEAVLLADDGRRFWVRLGDSTRGPVSAAYARRMLLQGTWASDTLACPRGEKSWQALGLLLGEVAAPTAGTPPPPPPPPPPAAAVAAPVAPTGAPAGGILPSHAEAPGLYAGFWRRVAAYLIDSLIVGVSLMLFGAMLGVVLAVGGRLEVLDNPGMEGALNLLGVFVLWLYFALFESSSRQATIGKLALGLRVTDLAGRRIGFGRATGRFFGGFISSLILCIGYMMAGWTSRKQTLHDMMAGSLVVRRSGQAALAAGTPAGVAPATGMPAWGIALIVLGAGGIPLLAILAAIALPAYQQYTIRAQVAEVLAQSTEAKRAVEDYWQRNDELPDDNVAAGLAHEEVLGEGHARKIQVYEGEVLVTFGDDEATNANLRGKHLIFTPQGEDAIDEWACSSPDIEDRYLPQRCRD